MHKMHLYRPLLTLFSNFKPFPFQFQGIGDLKRGSFHKKAGFLHFQPVNCLLNQFNLLMCKRWIYTYPL